MSGTNRVHASLCGGGAAAMEAERARNRKLAAAATLSGSSSVAWQQQRVWQQPPSWRRHSSGYGVLAACVLLRPCVLLQPTLLRGISSGIGSIEEIPSCCGCDAGADGCSGAGGRGAKPASAVPGAACCGGAAGRRGGAGGPRGQGGGGGGSGERRTKLLLSLPASGPSASTLTVADSFCSWRFVDTRECSFTKVCAYLQLTLLCFGGLLKDERGCWIVPARCCRAVHPAAHVDLHSRCTAGIASFPRASQIYRLRTVLALRPELCITPYTHR